MRKEETKTNGRNVHTPWNTFIVEKGFLRRSTKGFRDLEPPKRGYSRFYSVRY